MTFYLPTKHNQVKIRPLPKDGSLAQSVEQLAFNQLVEGSNPSRPTILKHNSEDIVLMILNLYPTRFENKLSFI